MKFSIATLIAVLSLTSKVIAAPTSISTSLVERDAASAIAAITGAVEKLKTDVEGDLQTIAVTVKGDPSPKIIPTVQFNLAKIFFSYNQAVATIIPQVISAQVNITSAQAQLLLNNAKTFDSLVLDIKTNFDQIIASVQSDTLASLKPKLQAVSSITSVLATNYVNYLTAVAGTVYGPNGVFAQLKSTANDINNIITGLLSQL